MWSVFPTTLPGQGPRAFINATLTPGKAYDDSVTVANYTTAPLTFNLYGADAVNTAGDGLSLRRRTDSQVAMGQWIHLPYSRLVVPAHGASTVPFSILPPARATPGDYLGGIVAEGTQGVTSPHGSVPITVIQAVGVRVYGRVVGVLHPRLELSKVSLTATNSAVAQLGGAVDARVNFTVRNAGNIILSPVANVVLTTPIGTAGRRTIAINQLLPGNSLHYSLNLSGLEPYGRLRAEVKVAGQGAKATGAATVWVLPWALLVLLIVALVVLGRLIIRIRRRRRGRGHSLGSGQDIGPARPPADGDLAGEEIHAPMDPSV
jgi:hypothetical protein